MIAMTFGGAVVSIAGVAAAAGLLGMNAGARNVLEIATWIVLAGALINTALMAFDAVSGVGANSAGLVLALAVVLIGIPFYVLLGVLLILLRGRAIRDALPV